MRSPGYFKSPIAKRQRSSTKRDPISNEIIIAQSDASTEDPFLRGRAKGRYGLETVFRRDLQFFFCSHNKKWANQMICNYANIRKSGELFENRKNPRAAPSGTSESPGFRKQKTRRGTCATAPSSGFKVVGFNK